VEQTQDLNVADTVPLVPPSVLLQQLPMTEAANRTVVTGREAIKRILWQSLGTCCAARWPRAPELRS
jgi:hypothetical protein